MPLRLLIIGAHPDDADYAAGGTAALYRAAGHTVRMVSLTNGDAGHHELLGPKLAQRRLGEATAAGGVIGAVYELFDIHDGELEPTLPNRWKVIQLIRTFEPDLILTHRPNDYHPDHRYTSQLVQDAAYMITVPAVVPGTKHLMTNPVIAYLPDEFQKPYPFTPTVAVDVGPVLERIVDMLHCHQSQFYEWLAYNTGTLDQVPRADADRRTWLGTQVKDRLRRQAQRFRAQLVQCYGPERGKAVEFAEAFEPCEYGAHLDDAAAQRLFPFVFGKAHMMRLPRRFWILVFVPTALLAFGTIGYQVVDDRYSFLDALYMTIITLSTIGYGETHALEPRGKVFTIVLVLGGVFGFAYSASEIIRSIVSGELAEYLGKQKMERALAHLEDHIIVCGYGRMGHLVCKEFSRLGQPYVVIDNRAEAVKSFKLPHGIILFGDATSDEMLKQAGVARAHSLVTVMASDADNLFATMSARLLNPKVVIVARVEDMQSEEKLRRAGANRIVSPYQIGGTRVALAVLKPTVVDFIELTTGREHIELQLEEATIEATSVLIGCNLKEARLRADHQIIIVAIKRKMGRMIFNPASDTILEAGDILVAMGSLVHLGKLDELAKAKSV